jgi:predicted RNA-binding Zn-ribbon protein involved in translation (DUF1610 family)
VVVYEDLKIANMVKNHNLAKSISDAGWCQYTQWLEYYGKIWDKAVVAVSPNYTSQDCSNCGHRAKKALSTRTHSCPSCGVEICRDTNAAINILKKGLNILGFEWQRSEKCGLRVSPIEAPFSARQGFEVAIEQQTFAARQDNSTSGQEGSASENEGKHGERCTSTVDEQSKAESNSL